MYNTAIESDDILSTLNKVLPKGIFDILLQLRPERTVVEESSKAVVYFRGGEDDPTTFA